jgi:hypothetical protein
VKALNVELAERRAARRKQLFAEALVSFYPLFRYLRKEAGEAFAEQVMHEIWSRETTRMAFRRFVSSRKGRSDIDRFIADTSYSKMQERLDRKRVLAAARKRRSRLKLKQSIKPDDDSVQVALT